MNPRPYQADAVLATAKGFMEYDKQLLVMPTGAGKTILFALIAKRFHDKRNERTLILAHREELIEQAASKIFAATGIQPEIEKAERRASFDAKIVVASVQTLQGQRLARWAQNHFGLVVCDEAHHVLADSWMRTLAHFDGYARVLGVTATPGRSDKRKLGSYFQNISYEIGLLDLIKQGYLSPIVIRTLPLQIDLGEVKLTSGDYDANQLAEAIEPTLRQVVAQIKRVAAKRKILVFLPLIKTSKLFAEICNQEGITAAHVDGEMKDRKSVLQAFHRNEFQVLVNALLLTEGYDQPDIDCVVMLRPTKSSGLYSQAVGRGTRISEGKENLLLLDFLWLHEKHNLVQPASLIAKDDKEAAAMSRFASDGKEHDLETLQDTAIADREKSLARELAANQRRKSKTISLEEVAVALHQPDIVDYEPTMRWHSSPPSQKQLEILKNNRIPAEAVKSRGHANELINRIFARSKHHLASMNQVVWLKRLGYPHPEAATAKEAKAFLDAKWGKKSS